MSLFGCLWGIGVCPQARAGVTWATGRTSGSVFVWLSVGHRGLRPLQRSQRETPARWCSAGGWTDLCLGVCLTVCGESGCVLGRVLVFRGRLDGSVGNLGLFGCLWGGSARWGRVVVFRGWLDEPLDGLGFVWFSVSHRVRSRARAVETCATSCVIYIILARVERDANKNTPLKEDTEAEYRRARNAAKTAQNKARSSYFMTSYRPLETKDLDGHS